MAKQQEVYSGVFKNMDFPAYTYEAYPMMMLKGKGKDAEERIVNSEAEQAAAEKEGFKAPERVGPVKTLTEQELAAKDDEIAALKAQLAEAAKAKPQGDGGKAAPGVSGGKA